MGRKKSGIVRIRLNTPTIQGYSLEPAPVNFFYGKNGVGKTSIGRALADPNAEITWKDGKPLQVFLFNEDYTEQVIRSVSGLPGVYALSGKNADIQRQIEEKTVRKEQIDVSVAEMKKELEQRRKNAAETDAERIRGIWKVTAEIRRKYPEAAGADDPEAFALRLSTYKANAYSQDSMAAAYEMAYGPKVDAEPYLHLYVTSFPACPLLAVPVFRHSETEAEHYREAGCLDWAISGHDRYLRDDRCPFCGQKLPDDFEARFRESLEPKGQADMEKLKAFSEEYAEAAQKARETVLKNLGNPLGSDSYRLKGTQLLSRLENNRILIQRKMDNPRLEIHLEDTEQLIRELNEIEEEVNKKISRMIRMARDVPQARKRCEKVIWESMAWSCQDLLRVLTAGREENEAELSSLELKVRTEEGRARLLDREIRELRGAMTDISGTMEKINRSLNDNDFTGFRFAKRDDNTYEIVRENGPATGLSEGERKFVAFLYFYHTVLGSRRADAAPEEKVLVIDDPATSTDSEVMSIFAVMIREMAQRCRARFCEGVESGPAPDSGVHQLFFFTHNKVFFQMVANDSISDNTCSRFYEVRKNRQNESSVIPCLRKSELAGGEEINATPVVGDYQEMWMELKKTEDPRTMLRLCRGILSKYFLDTCHYSGTDLRKVLLEQNRDAFVQQGLGGLDAGFGIVSAMVALMGMNPVDTMDSVYFDIRAVNTEQIRFVFRRIFEVMKQEQHYHYMSQV